MRHEEPSACVAGCDAAAGMSSLLVALQRELAGWEAVDVSYARVLEHFKQVEQPSWAETLELVLVLLTEAGEHPNFEALRSFCITHQDSLPWGDVDLEGVLRLVPLTKTMPMLFFNDLLPDHVGADEGLGWLPQALATLVAARRSDPRVPPAIDVLMRRVVTYPTLMEEGSVLDRLMVDRRRGRGLVSRAIHAALHQLEHDRTFHGSQQMCLFLLQRAPLIDEANCYALVDRMPDVLQGIEDMLPGASSEQAFVVKRVVGLAAYHQQHVMASEGLDVVDALRQAKAWCERRLAWCGGWSFERLNHLYQTTQRLNNPYQQTSRLWVWAQLLGGREQARRASPQGVGSSVAKDVTRRLRAFQLTGEQRRWFTWRLVIEDACDVCNAVALTTTELKHVLSMEQCVLTVRRLMTCVHQASLTGVPVSFSADWVLERLSKQAQLNVWFHGRSDQPFGLSERAVGRLFQRLHAEVMATQRVRVYQLLTCYVLRSHSPLVSALVLWRTLRMQRSDALSLPTQQALRVRTLAWVGRWLPGDDCPSVDCVAEQAGLSRTFTLRNRLVWSGWCISAGGLLVSGAFLAAQPDNQDIKTILVLALVYTGILLLLVSAELVLLRRLFQKSTAWLVDYSRRHPLLPPLQGAHVLTTHADVEAQRPPQPPETVHPPVEPSPASEQAAGSRLVRDGEAAGAHQPPV